MKSFKIGEVSKITGMPVETIRFFEKKGLITPEKKELSKYRYFDLDDIDQLLDYRKYRNMDFSLNESIDIITESGMNAFMMQLESKRKEAETLARFYQEKAVKLQNYENVLRDIPKIEGRIHFKKQPGIYFLPLRTRKDDEVSFCTDEKMLQLQEDLLKAHMFLETTICIEKEDLEARSDNSSYGFSIKEMWSDHVDSQILNELEYIPSFQRAVYSYVRKINDERFSSRDVEYILDYISQNDYEIAGDLISYLIASVKEDDDLARYYEVWIPVAPGKH